MPTLTGKIRLCKNINIDRDYKNVLNYTESQMLSLCESQAHLVASANDYSFIRNRGTISTNFSYDDCLKANYIAFQNKDYSNKWFFAFIDDVMYVGENNTEIKYTIDSWSTWFDNWTAKPCFVLREHTNDDTIGANTELENLDVGEVVCESITKDITLTSASGFFVAVSTNYIVKDNTTGLEPVISDRGIDYSGVSVYNRNIFGTRIILFYVTTANTFVNNLTRFIKRVNHDGKVSAIENMFILPSTSVPLNAITLHTAYFETSDSDHEFQFYTIPNTIEPKTWYNEISKITSYSGVTIKNNKCFCYPYNYLLVSNGNGSNNIYKYENFYSNTCKFLSTFAVSIGGSGRIAPLNYKESYPSGTTDFDSANYDECLPLGKLPTCSWASDAFTNWLTANSVNIAVSAIFGALGLVSGIAGAKMGATSTQAGNMSASQTGLSASGSVASFFGDFYQARLLPNISGGQATGDVVWAEDRNIVYFKQMRAKSEYIQKIDDYFTRFGYKTNRLKTPNITGRTYWNYIEISSSDEIGTGSVPEKYWSEINSVCQRGVTIWHSHDNIGNYNLNNTIVL